MKLNVPVVAVVFLIALFAGNNNIPAKCHAFSARTASRTTPIKSTAAMPKSTQLLEFREPTTGVMVKLVGCMHYNPASIKLTEDTIQSLAANNQLGSVVIESCDIRWNQTNSLPTAAKALLMSEMKKGCDLAVAAGRPVVLGDQRINLTVASLKNGLQETLSDMSTPWSGGWARYWNNVTVAREEALPFGSSYYLNAFAFLDPKLLLAAPVSLIKYPLSYFVKSPLKTTAVLALLVAFDQSPSEAATLSTMTIEPSIASIGERIGSLAVSGLEIAFFARIFLKELLMQRNVLLAQNILEQCKLYQSTVDLAPAKPSFSLPLFGNLLVGGPRSSPPNLEIVYAEGTSAPLKDGKPGEDKAVVAILGMAHCNGIAKLLQEQRI